MECNIAIYKISWCKLIFVYTNFVVYGNHENILTTKISGKTKQL